MKLPPVYTAVHRYDYWVQLTKGEIVEAVEHGKKMRDSSVARGFRDRVSEGGMRKQIVGAIAESAVAKAMGMPWRKWIDTFKKPDVDHNIEARLIGVDHYGLRVKEGDHDSRRVVGIVMERGRESKPCRIPGWILAKDAKQERLKIDPGDRGLPMYAVPQSELRDIRELMEMIKAEKSHAPDQQETA